jgi:hypothetical protein
MTLKVSTRGLLESMDTFKPSHPFLELGQRNISTLNWAGERHPAAYLIIHNLDVESTTLDLHLQAPPHPQHARVRSPRTHPPSSRNKAPRPNNPHALRSLIASQNPPPKFTCDLCSPKEYTFFWNCPKPPYFQIALEQDDKKNMFGNECLKVLQPSGPLLSCESMHLTRKTIEYFYKPEEELNYIQLHALSEIRRWRNSRMADILGPDTELDRSKLLPETEMQALWRLTCNLFFGRSSSRHVFRWSHHFIRGQEGMAGLPHWPVSYIRLRAVSLYKDLSGCSVVLHALGTLLHEIAHIYLQNHACRFCSAAEWNVSRNGHGRAFQLLAAKVEKCWTVWTGLPVDLHRFHALWHWWKGLHALPSLHDLEEWDFESTWVNKFLRAQLVHEYGNQRGEENGCVDLEKWVREWWAMGSNSDYILADLGGEEARWWGLKDGAVAEADDDGYEVAGRIATVSGEMIAECECGEVDEAE